MNHYYRKVTVREDIGDQINEIQNQNKYVLSRGIYQVFFMYKPLNLLLFVPIFLLLMRIQSHLSSHY